LIIFGFFAYLDTLEILVHLSVNIFILMKNLLHLWSSLLLKIQPLFHLLYLLD